MAPADELLAPIPGSAPGGIDLRDDPLFDKIKEARREELEAPQGAWEKPRKVADWPLALKLATEALTKRTKDLEIAAWLTEALVWREGFPGLRRGLDLMRGLLVGHWDHVHPALDEDGDASLRARPLLWLGLKLDLAVKSVPVTQSGLSLLDHQRSRKVGYEADVGDDYERQKAWQRAMESEQLSADAFDAAVGSTPKAWYKTLVADIEAARKSLKELEAASDERFGEDPPSYSALSGALEDVAHVAGQFLAKKLELDPDPVDVLAASEPSAEAGAQGGGATPAGAGTLTAEPANKDDAAARVIVVARFLRKLDATDPTPYLMLRALRWGELRAGGPAPNPRLLQPPPATARVQMRTLFLDGKWPELLEAAETIMGTPAGRAWLDLQRYAYLACAQLGDDYGRVARALRSELRVLLEEVPELGGMTLMDDMPAATSETRAWLAETFGGEAPPAASAEGAPAASPPPAPSAPTDRVHAQAMGEVRAGRPQRAVEILMRELDRETSPRARFLRQAQLARIMVDSGLDAIAQPILEDMLKMIEAHKLEEWEVGTMVAQPITLMFRCLERLNGDATERQALYLRLCRLDPLTALEFSKPA
ncbi:MAG: type VI secretion system protein TssA [Gemmatimonadales bacterium]